MFATFFAFFTFFKFFSETFFYIYGNKIADKFSMKSQK